MDYWGVPAPREKGDSEGPKSGIMAILGPPFLCIFLKELDPFWTLFGPFLVLFSTFSPFGHHWAIYRCIAPLYGPFWAPFQDPKKGVPKQLFGTPFEGFEHIWPYTTCEG